MSGPVITVSDLHRALDIAGSIALSAMPKHAATAAATNDVLDLARAVVALARIGDLAAEYIAAQSAALDATELPLNTMERFAASETADAAVDTAHEALIQALVACGYLYLEDPETTHGSAS